LPTAYLPTVHRLLPSTHPNSELLFPFPRLPAQSGDSPSSQLL
jgi:hypothetical protein